MSGFTKLLAVLALIVGVNAVASSAAEARWGHRHWHGGWGWRAPYPYYGYYGPPYYAGPPACGYARVLVWRNGYRVWRRVWRCW